MTVTMEKIFELSAPGNSNTLEITGLDMSQYKNYKIFINAKSSDTGGVSVGHPLNIRFSLNGTTWNSSSITARVGCSDGSGLWDWGQASSTNMILHAVPDSYNGGFYSPDYGSVDMMLYMPTELNRYPFWTSRSVQRKSATGNYWLMQHWGTVPYQTTDGITGMRFQISIGNFVNGTKISMYGF